MWHFISLLTFLLTLGTPCERISCQNGGYCIQPATATTLAYCHCPATYTGYRCEQSGRDARAHQSIELHRLVRVLLLLQSQVILV